MLDYMGPDERADAMCKAADEQRRAKLAETAAKIDAKALGKLAADMGLHDHQNRDSGAGLPLVMTGSDATRRLDDLTGNGRTPGGQNDTASRTDAAPFSLTDRERKASGDVSACHDVEHAAWTLLVNSGLTPAQHELLRAYHNTVWATRSASHELESARQSAMFARMIGGAK